MNAVDEVTGTIAELLTRPYGEVRTGYTWFAEGDVLFAKITPCMENGKALIARGLIDGIGFGSTEFHVLRPRQHLLAEWVFYFVRQKSFRNEAAGRFRGSAGQQRVPEDFLRPHPFPVPPPPDQRRIVGKIEALFERIREAKRLQAEAIKQASELVEAALADVFADESRWERCDLGNLIAIEAKAVDPTLPRHRRLPHVNGTLIEPVTGELAECRTADEDRMTSVKYLFSPGEVLYSKIRPYLRKAALVVFTGLCSADIYPLRVAAPGRLLPEFLRWTLVSEPFTRYANNLSQRARMPKLNRQQLFAYEMGLPSITDQRAIVDHLTRVSSLSGSLATAQQASAAGLDRLEQSVLDMAFRGGL
jgi:type I restriction enzyme S subunit